MTLKELHRKLLETVRGNFDVAECSLRQAELLAQARAEGLLESEPEDGSEN